MTPARARRRALGVLLAIVVAVPAAAQSRGAGRAGAPDSTLAEPPIPVIAVGDGATFANAVAQAVRMAVESGAGLTLSSSLATRGERVVSDSMHAVSRGIVTRYALLDSAGTPSGVHVKILAMVARIRERPLTTPSGHRVGVPGALWAAGSALDRERTREEGEIVGQIFGASANTPSLYSYVVQAGPPVDDRGQARLRLRVIRTPNANYGAVVDRVAAILAAVAGPAGDRVLPFPPQDRDVDTVRPCVSLCGPDERQLVDVRAVFAPTDSFAAFDPPLVTSPGRAAVADLFPELPTAGGYAIAIADRVGGRVRIIHLRSTRAYFAVVDYLRTLVDEARFRVTVNRQRLALRQTFRAPWTGAPSTRLLVSDSASLATALVHGFRERTSGPPGAGTRFDSQDAIFWVPDARSARPDTAEFDLWIPRRDVAGLREIRIDPLATTHRLPPPECSRRLGRWPDGTIRSALICRYPDPIDARWRAARTPAWGADQ